MWKWHRWKTNDPNKDPYRIANCIGKLKTIEGLLANEHLKIIDYLKEKRVDREIFKTMEHDVLKILKKLLGR